ncbi:UNVERIFIED_CONTAM: hypothetical protein Slati_4197800 [Sesamum latifolium]|uniref:Uncharacterized protein n=1 Tax=Sesamum latifolium TaxID=2727402 RepID=A0AAW2TAD0_9LAMI
MLTLILTKGRELIPCVGRIKPVLGRGFREKVGGEGGSFAGRGGQPEGGEKRPWRVSEGGEGSEEIAARGEAMQEEHAEELRAQADQVRKDFPKTEEGKNLLEACWASRLAKDKKSDAYQKEVALVAGPFLRFAFEACRQQFLAHGYPPAG